MVLGAESIEIGSVIPVLCKTADTGGWGAVAADALVTGTKGCYVNFSIVVFLYDGVWLVSFFGEGFQK